MKTALTELKERLLVDAENFPDRAPYIYEIIGDIDGELLQTEKQNLIDSFEHNPKVTTNEKGTLISIPGIDYYNEKYGSTNKETLK